MDSNAWIVDVWILLLRGELMCVDSNAWAFAMALLDEFGGRAM